MSVGVEVQLHAFSTSVLERDEVSFTSRQLYPPVKRSLYPLDRGRVVHRDGLEGVVKKQIDGTDKNRKPAVKRLTKP
jgi:hypothetical protein